MIPVLNEKENESKIAIVVIGYDRISSIKRLLNSLLNANYYNYDVPLIISIDFSTNYSLHSYVNEFCWPFGKKYVFISEARLGLKEHIFRCGDFSQFFKAIILLEDDIYVSPNFYNYVISTVHKYYNDHRIAGISLYKHEQNGFNGIPFTPLQTGSDVFIMQTVVSWGQCWTRLMWYDFKRWLDLNPQIDFNLYEMPVCIKDWKNAWSKYYYAYILSTDKYFVFPYVSLSTNFNDVGEHSNQTDSDWQVNLLFGRKEYILENFENLVKYDVFLNNIFLYNFLSLSKNELTIDLYGDKNNISVKKYLLTINNLPYLILKKYGLCLRPIELNVILNIEGNSIFLYDTSIISNKRHDSFNYINKIYNYHFGYIKKAQMIKYLFSKTLTKLINKIF